MTANEGGPQKKNRLDSPRDETFLHDLTNFTPSRGRDPLATGLSGGAGSQPAGAALPSLVRGEILTPNDHVVAAGRVNPTATLLTTVLPPRSRAAVHRCVSSPDTVLADRISAISSLRALGSSLASARSRWSSSLPPDSPARCLHLPLFSILARRFDYPDTCLLKDLSDGMPIVGKVPASSTLRGLPRNARTSFADWKRAIPTTNKRVIKNMLKKQGSVASNQCWSTTLEEVKRGWLTPPIPLTDEIATKLPLPRGSRKQNSTGCEMKNPRYRRF